MVSTSGSGRSRRAWDTYFEVFTQHITESEWGHALRLRSLCYLHSMLVCASDEVDGSTGMADTGVACENVCNDQRVKVPQVRN